MLSNETLQKPSRDGLITVVTPTQHRVSMSNVSIPNANKCTWKRTFPWVDWAPDCSLFRAFGWKLFG
jgi:hypothetical protein